MNEDRISVLPRNLIDRIIERMSTRDAARTSILSKHWRYIWSTHPQLLLDKQFFDGTNINIQQSVSEFVRTITNILVVHSGTIQKFNLHIPFHQSPDMDLWILLLSRNGIKEFTFDNVHSQPYILPSYIFSCVELTSLSLFNCIILNPPLAFGGLHNLNKLVLRTVSLSPLIGTLISSLPVLKYLVVDCCTGVENIKILPPKLTAFGVNSHEFDWQCFNNISHLAKVYVELCKNVEQRRDFDLMRLLANLPCISFLHLDGFSLKFLSAGTISNCIQIKVYHLTKLRVRAFRFNDLDQISCSLSLLSTSPNLQNLEIESSKITNDAVEPVLNYMETAVHLNEKLNELQEVKLSFLNGVRTELLFTKLLLAHSPSLKRMVIGCRSGIDANEELRILKEVMWFPRASTIAQIVFT